MGAERDSAPRSIRGRRAISKRRPSGRRGEAQHRVSRSERRSLGDRPQPWSNPSEDIQRPWPHRCPPRHGPPAEGWAHLAGHVAARGKSRPAEGTRSRWASLRDSNRIAIYVGWNSEIAVPDCRLGSSTAASLSLGVDCAGRTKVQPFSLAKCPRMSLGYVGVNGVGRRICAALCDHQSTCLTTSRSRASRASISRLLPGNSGDPDRRPVRQSACGIVTRSEQGQSSVANVKALASSPVDARSSTMSTRA
jgi:hypothetical protein